MDYIDYYKTLEVSKTATAEEIKKAYKKLARKYHPDLNPNDTTAKANFQKINEANSVLSDPENRKKYDKYGKDWQHAEEFEKARQNQSTNSRGASGFGGQAGNDYSDFFESMFGGQTGGRRSRPVNFRGDDVHADLHLPLMDVYKTQKKTINVNNKSIRINIPAGIENEQIIKITGHGTPGINGGPNGDLYITFYIADHPSFKRLGNNLYTTVDLDVYTAVLGGELTTETLDGKVKLKVSPETQNGIQVKLKGKGFPVYKKEGSFGDLYVTYNIKIPTNLSAEQKELFMQLSKM